MIIARARAKMVSSSWSTVSSSTWSMPPTFLPPVTFEVWGVKMNSNAPWSEARGGLTKVASITPALRVATG